MTRRLCAALLCLLGAACARERTPRGVVLITIDTLRADHLGSYGYSRPTSPFLDGLARDGVLFENAFSSVSQTSPAHASIMTGLYMAQHRVVRNGMGLPPRARSRTPTLADAFSLAGYDTAAFTAVGFLKGVTAGFSTVDVGTLWRDYRRADETVDAALRWLQGKRTTDRFFVWIHLFDPHTPHRAPEPDEAAVAFASEAEADAFGRARIDRDGVTPGFFASSAALVKRYVEYDAEIHFADRELARLHGQLAATGQDDGVLWVVTADHGEALGNHGHDAHGRHVYHEELRVPLILSGAGLPRGRRVSELVRHVDLFPTLAQLCGLRVEATSRLLPGRSLDPVLGTPPRSLSPAVAFAQRRPPDPDWEPGDVYTAFDRDWKYIVHTNAQDEFYDLREDRLELRNLGTARSSVKERLGRTAREMFAGFGRDGRDAGSTAVDPGSLEELKALGYLK
jgi:arylsulfatase A-like enzyme